MSTDNGPKDPASQKRSPSQDVPPDPGDTADTENSVILQTEPAAPAIYEKPSDKKPDNQYLQILIGAFAIFLGGAAGYYMIRRR